MKKQEMAFDAKTVRAKEPVFFYKKLTKRFSFSVWNYDMILGEVCYIS